MSSDKYSDSADMPPVNSTIDEQLSAFIDGELPQEEMELLLRRIEGNDDCRSRFSRYVSIGSVLRGDVSQSDRIRVGVMQAISGIEQPDQERPEKAVKARSGFGLRVAGLAAVAGICGLAVMGVQPSLLGLGGPSELTVAEVVTPAGAAAATPIQQAASKQAVQSDRMTSYLAAHGEHAKTISWRVAEPGFAVQQASLGYR